MTAIPIAIITCVYRNETTAMQIARIDDIPEFHLERMVMPGQCLMFEAPITASLQIHSNRMMTAVWEDTIPCQQLQYEADTTVVLMQPNLSCVAA